MKTTTLVSLVGVAFISLAQPGWARIGGAGGGGHFEGGGAHFGGGRGFGGGARYFGGGPRFGGGARFYSGGPRFSSFSARPSMRPGTFARPNRGLTTQSALSARTLNRQPGQFTRRQATVSGTRAFNSSNRRNIVAERHGRNWHRDWDRRRAHFFHNRFFVFDDGFWVGLDDGFYPYDYYGYGDPSYYGDNESADPYSDSTVSAAQSKLAGQGYYRGPIDGVYGPQTRTALTRYQRTRGLQGTGTLSPATLRALGIS